MKSFSLLPPILLYLHLLFLFGPNTVMAETVENQTDYLALLKFKESISSDPYRILDSWNSSIHFCNWSGITCNPKHKKFNEISGKVPAELGNQVNLILLAMENNHFEGFIPTNFENLKSIQVLKLDNNMLSRSIPFSIGNLSQLFYLDMSNNMLEGNIPLSLGKCQKLQYLNLSQNNLQGSIPLEFLRISSLTMGFDLSQNSLSGSLLST